jgi:hypothetical protein
MSEAKPIADVGPLEILADWEGPAIHEPGVLFEERQGEHLAAHGDVAGLAAWIAVSALSGVQGSTASGAIQEKVRGVLSEWRRRFGQAKVDAVKAQLLQDVQRYRHQRKLTDEELRAHRITVRLK